MEKMPLVQVAQNKKAKICKKTNAEVALLPRFLQIVYIVVLLLFFRRRNAFFCEFVRKLLDKAGKILYNMVVKMSSRKSVHSRGLDANQNKEKTS